MKTSWSVPSDATRVGPFRAKDLRLTSDDQIMLSSLTRVRDASSSSPQGGEIPVFVAEHNPACSLFLINAYGWYSPMNYLEMSRQLIYATRCFDKEVSVGRGAMSAFKFEKDIPRAAKGDTVPIIRYRVLKEKPQQAAQTSGSGKGGRVERVRPKYVDELGREYRYEHAMEYIHVTPEEAKDLPYHIGMDDNRSVVISFSCYWLPSENYEHFRTRARKANIKSLRPDVVMPPFRTVLPRFSYPTGMSMSNQVFSFLNTQLLTTSPVQSVSSSNIEAPTPTLHNPHPAASKSPIVDNQPKLNVVTPRTDSLIDLFTQTTLDLTRTKLVYSDHTSGAMAWALLESALSEALQQADLCRCSNVKEPCPSWTFDEVNVSLGKHAELDIPWTHRVSLYDTETPKQLSQSIPRKPVSAVQHLTGRWDCSHPGSEPSIRSKFKLRRLYACVGDGSKSKL